VTCVIRLIATEAGFPTEYDGQYVKRYDPTYVHPVYGYDGGILEVTSDLREAQRYADAGAALAAWARPYGVREDGQPNRPLTAWTIEVEPLPVSPPDLRAAPVPSDCRCDCVSCATNDHLGCYYKTPDGKTECPIAAWVEGHARPA
jgi:hypothetical protein